MTSPPIVMAAFGTTSRAMDTYSFIHTAVKRAFPEHPVKWAYTSRMVRAHMKREQRANLKHPREVLNDLHENGYNWSVVQSLHIVCGHEFYRLVDDIKGSPVRTSTGLPLLTSPSDYEHVAKAILRQCIERNGAATVLIGHGTDHPAWTAYPALARCLEKHGARDVFVGTVEDASSIGETLEAVLEKGYTHAYLVPLMLVAGVHVREDIAGEEASWKTAFEGQGVSVSIVDAGLGKNPAVVDLFIQHIREALALIPE